MQKTLLQNLSLVTAGHKPHLLVLGHIYVEYSHKFLNSKVEFVVNNAQIV